MNIHDVGRLCGVLGIALSVHCGSSPEPIYYALRATHASAPGKGGDGRSSVAWAHVIKLRRPSIAGYLDRADIVSRMDGYRLRVTSGDSWGEPLGDMIGRVLAEDLNERLGGKSVVFTEMSPLSTPPDAVVSLDVQRFDEGDDGTVTLHGEVQVEKASDQSNVATRNVDLRIRTNASGTPGLVAAMSELVSQLADQVARDLS